MREDARRGEDASEDARGNIPGGGLTSARGIRFENANRGGAIGATEEHGGDFRDEEAEKVGNGSARASRSRQGGAKLARRGELARGGDAVLFVSRRSILVPRDGIFTGWRRDDSVDSTRYAHGGRDAVLLGADGGGA